MVGGQALNIWAERYAHHNELSAYAPFTSKDLDYFGTREAAQKIADKLGGTVQVSDVDDHTPNTAMLIAEIDGDEIVVDFIDHVFGVHDRDAKKMVAIVSLPMAKEKNRVDVAISIMHPIHCLMSRAANALSPALERRDETAMRQLNAAVYVLGEFLNDLLRHNEHGRASKILKMLYRYLRSDIYGRDVHSLTDKDPLEILREFSQDNRLHPKFRPHLTVWLREIEGRRKNRELRRRRHA